jgi:hypothetical protein
MPTQSFGIYSLNLILLISMKSFLITKYWPDVSVNKIIIVIKIYLWGCIVAMKNNTEIVPNINITHQTVRILRRKTTNLSKSIQYKYNDTWFWVNLVYLATNCPIIKYICTYKAFNGCSDENSFRHRNPYLIKTATNWENLNPKTIFICFAID